MNVLDYPIPSPAESKGGASGAALAALDWSRAQGPASPPPPRSPWGCKGAGTRSLVWAFLLPLLRLVALAGGWGAVELTPWRPAGGAQGARWSGGGGKGPA